MFFDSDFVGSATILSLYFVFRDKGPGLNFTLHSSISTHLISLSFFSQVYKIFIPPPAFKIFVPPPKNFFKTLKMEVQRNVPLHLSGSAEF